MSRLSQFLGKDETTPRERFLFLESAVWAAPVSGLYKITAIGGGGSAGKPGAIQGWGESGGATIVQMPNNLTATLGGGEGGVNNENPDKRPAKGGVASFIEGAYVRDGGDGGLGVGSDGYPGLGLHTFMGLSSRYQLRGSGGASSTGADMRPLGGGGNGSLTYGGGAGGAILYRYPIHLSAGQQITITIGGGYSPGIAIIERF